VGIQWVKLTNVSSQNRWVMVFILMLYVDDIIAIVDEEEAKR
jgi:hypothetical protein